MNPSNESLVISRMIAARLSGVTVGQDLRPAATVLDNFLSSRDKDREAWIGFQSDVPLATAPISSAPDGATPLNRLMLGGIAWKAFVTSLKQTTDDCPYDFGKPPHEEGIAIRDAAMAVAEHVARKLEQQRDALKRENVQLRFDLLESDTKRHRVLEPAIEDLRASLAQAQHERDEAQEEALTFKKGFEASNEVISAASQEVEGLKALLGMDTPWPVELLLKALVVAETRLRETGRDFDGWESIQTAASVAAARLADKGMEGKP